MPTHSRKYMLQVYFWALSYLKPYWKIFLLFVISGFFSSMVQLSIPKFLEYFIDVIVEENQLFLFYNLFIALVVVLVLMFITNALGNLWHRQFREQAVKDIQFAMFDKLRKLGFTYYEQHSIGETLSLFNTEISAVRDIYQRYFPEIIRLIIFITISSILLVSIHPLLSLMILPFFLSYYLIGPYFERKAAEYGKERAENRIQLNKKLYDSISSLYECRAYGQEGWEKDQLTAKQEKYHKSHLSEYLFAYLRGTVRRFTLYFGALVMFILGIKSVQNGTISVGELVAFSFLYFQVLGPLTGLVTLITEQKVSMFQVERVYHFMSQKVTVPETENPRTLERIQGDLQFKNLHFGYPSQPRVIKGFDLHIKAGERLAFVGTSGNGKSTLLKLIGRFYDPDEGEILLDGVSLKECSFQQIRESIGYVFQETYLFGTSVMENIRFGHPDASDQEVVEAAKAAFAHDFIKELPQGYDTLVGERGIKLSGGQKQRIAIARMFIKNPSIVVLDEATSALDNVSEHEVQLALEQLLKRRTTIAVAHRLSTIQDFDRIIVIEEGQNAEMGTYQGLIQKRGLFYQLAEGS